jgi:hypothetical protein
MQCLEVTGMAVKGYFEMSDSLSINNDHTAIFVQAIEELKKAGGGVLQLSGGVFRINPKEPIVLDKVVVRGMGMGATRIIVGKSLPAGSAAFVLPSGETGYTTGLEDLHLAGPAEPRRLGQRSTMINGAEARTKCFFTRVKISDFNYGININGASHVQIISCRLEANYYNLYFQRDEGDHTIFDTEFTGAAIAGIAISGDKEGHSGTWIMRCHTGYCPYGIYQEAPTNPGAKQGFFNGWTIDNLRFEGIGNAAIYSERWSEPDCGTVRNCIIKNVGFSWNYNESLPNKPRDYAVYMGGVFGTMIYEPGDAPFHKGPQGTGVFRLRANGAIWLGEFNYSDFTVGADGKADKGPLMPYNPEPVTLNAPTSGRVVMTEMADHGLGAGGRPYRKIVLEFQNYVNRSGSDHVIPFSCHLSKPPVLLNNTTTLNTSTVLNLQSNREIRIRNVTQPANGYIVLFGS